jgi:hypothetical protein
MPGTREEARANIIDALRGILELRFREQAHTEPAADTDSALLAALGGIAGLILGVGATGSSRSLRTSRSSYRSTRSSPPPPPAF